MRYNKEYNVWVSKDGLIFGTKGGTKLHVFHPSNNGKGYAVVAVYVKGVRKTRTVHRIVWETFNGMIPAGLVIDHKDRNRMNNELDNLRLCTTQENNLYQERNEFGKLYYAKYNMKKRDNIAQYQRELYYFRQHGKCRWEEE